MKTNKREQLSKNVFSRQGCLKTTFQWDSKYQMTLGCLGWYRQEFALTCGEWAGWVLSAVACFQLPSFQEDLAYLLLHNENTLRSQEKNGISIVWMACIQPFERRWLSGSRINSGSLLLALHQNISSICTPFPDRVQGPSDKRVLRSMNCTVVTIHSEYPLSHSPLDTSKILFACVVSCGVFATYLSSAVLRDSSDCPIMVWRLNKTAIACDSVPWGTNWKV